MLVCFRFIDLGAKRSFDEYYRKFYFSLHVFAIIALDMFKVTTVTLK